MFVLLLVGVFLVSFGSFLIALGFGLLGGYPPDPAAATMGGTLNIALGAWSISIWIKSVIARPLREMNEKNELARQEALMPKHEEEK